MGPGQPALHNCWLSDTHERWPSYELFSLHSSAFAGGGYHVFAGKECSRALAKMKISSEDCNDMLSDCTVREMETLKDWETRFAEKYGIVGQVGSSSAGPCWPLKAGAAQPPELPGNLMLCQLSQHMSGSSLASASCSSKIPGCCVDCAPERLHDGGAGAV